MFEQQNALETSKIVTHIAMCSYPIQIMYFQSTLNCEVLSGSLGLELRWTLSDGDIILQLVSNTGSDRYLALGVKDDAPTSRGIAGDVMVGWISSKTGKGGIDDYFLASDTIKCEDGAESCPDSSKGGSKDVELLNAVSRANYTMLTLRRPLLAQGTFDVDIDINNDQNIFWSVGYKSAAQRKLLKPVKNTAPISIKFGRTPSWNCPVDEGLPSNAETNKKKTEKPVPDVPRRRISSPSILTPSVVQYRPISQSTQRPPIQRPALTFRPMQTQRPLVKRPKPISAPGKTWNDWLSPPTRPELSAGGFTPGTEPDKPIPRIIAETLSLAGSDNSDWRVPNIGCSQSADGPLYIQLGPATMMKGNQGMTQAILLFGTFYSNKKNSLLRSWTK